jgi:hypothetical protein
VTDRLISLTGDVGPARDLLAAFKVTSRFVAWADTVGPRLARRIQQRAPRGKGPGAGRLADATRYQRRTAIGLVRLEFHADRGGPVPYMPYVIKGTRPHDIVPKAARVLHWTAPGGSGVFARKVHHPGTKPNDYPRRAYQDLKSEVVAAFHEAFRGIR